MTLAGLYLRQSMDRDGRSEGIDRQRARARALVESRGWEIVDEYVDNDVSASKPRGKGTAWHRLIEDAKAERVDVVVAVDQDRILRGIRDLVTLLETGVRLATVDGELDLTTADGEFRATLAAGLARFEVRRKSERQKRANAHRRERLLPAGGRRAFGYTKLRAGASTDWPKRVAADGREWPDYGHEPFEPEATAVRRGYAMLLAGATLRSIARTWNAEGLTTTVGHEFEAYAVRNVLANPRNAGLVAPPRSASTPGQSAAQNLRLADLPIGSWEPLVTPETWAAARDLLADPTRRTNPGAPPKSLLSGIAKCGICGAPMKAGAVADVRSYRCAERPHLSRKREDADHFITHVVLDRLARPDAAEMILRRDDAPDAAALRARLLAKQQGEANVLALVAGGHTTLAKAEAMLRDLRAEMAALEAQMTDRGRVDVLGDVVARADAAGEGYAARWTAVADAWQALDVDRQRAIVRALVAIEMKSPGKGSRTPRDPAGRLAHTKATLALTWH
ncbi:recombinase family protein [Microbacterium sp. PAMC21962]|uniref:recombinase family protein n=1 Tax=Microbacterium sp. PAMC21962 TaxID=2861280 RepID=UPI001C631DFB|nr:recombinase family protein [Microbacterium sp. PAMC21962]QYF98280.1 recombinase family protein [Microbacterium sp. PAMC21962]